MSKREDAFKVWAEKTYGTSMHKIEHGGVALDSRDLAEAFENGWLEGLDEGERAQCRKCYNRGYEDGAALGEQDDGDTHPTRNAEQAICKDQGCPYGRPHYHDQSGPVFYSAKEIEAYLAQDEVQLTNKKEK